MTKTAIILMMAALIGGCSVSRTSLPLATCKLDSERLPVDIPGLEEGIGAPMAGGLSPYEEDLADKLVAAAEQRGLAEPSTTGSKQEIRQLILSGGGQWGSFGVGFMRAWARRDEDPLPRFDSVTGVSTGALQATLAFLGTDSASDDREFPADEDFEPGWKDSTEREFQLDDLYAGYSITRPETLYRYRGTKGLFRRATAGDLVPLESRMRRLVSPKTLEAIAREGADSRQLKVALVDWDSGEAVVIDMVALASQYDGTNFKAVQDCYVKVLLAASSETLVMPPVRIAESDALPGQGHSEQERLYFDAGIRFGVFADQARNVGRVAARRLEERSKRDTLATTYILANNDLFVPPLRQAKRSKYNALDLIVRGRQILVNQVYLLSVERIFAATDNADERVRFAFVRQADLAKCQAVKDAEEKLLGDKPFYPEFMKCLMARGKERGEAAAWDHPRT